jgi:protein-S-isoprenylcysteine O-methyltransferase Ste14
MRVLVSRAFGVVIVLLLLFTGHSFEDDTWTDKLLEISGVLLLSLCSLGRLWALMYVSGHKSEKLITEGPYSTVRHPLYLFTFIGVIGIGLASENVLVLGSLAAFSLSYYPLTIVAEERRLREKFGQDYSEYAEHTPILIPNISLYREPEHFDVKTTKFVRNFVDAMWFIWAFPVLHLIEMLQSQGILPVILKVP